MVVVTKPEEALAEPKIEERPPGIREAEEIREQHLKWLESGGTEGKQADLTRARLDGADLTDANLRNAVLNQANLKKADLLLADLRGASLLQANLEGANLLGAKLQDADLQGAILDGASGVLAGQIAGANLFAASLPESVSLPEGLRHVQKLAHRIGWMFVAILALNALVWTRIATTVDVLLVRNAPALPLPGLRALLPLVPFYLFGPVILLGVYVCFHLYIQRLWHAAAALPAIFPDGRRLDASLPWFVRWPARDLRKWLRGKRSAQCFLETLIAKTLLYWIVPGTLLLFWTRYLTLEDMRGSTLQVLLVVAATISAMHFPTLALRSFASDSADAAEASRAAESFALSHAPGMVAFGALLFLVSIGTILGAPHDSGHRQGVAAPGVRVWATNLLWLAGYDPFPQVAESDVSTMPANWSGRDEDLAQVHGANLNQLRLRYLQGYAAFFAKAHLWQADLRNAYLSDADFREANLRQASLQSAVLIRARFGRASLQEANLQEANLTQADLRSANLSYAMMAGVAMLDAKLDAANLYAANLKDAQMQRDTFENADLREAMLEGADFSMGDLREAYLSSATMSGAKLQQAQLAQAILTGADLRRANLSGANLQGAILSGADLTGANLADADLRGALGLGATQVCSAATLRAVHLDDNLQRDVDLQCGTNH